jgi:hypothetical protein
LRTRLAVCMIADDGAGRQKNERALSLRKNAMLLILKPFETHCQIAPGGDR